MAYIYKSDALRSVLGLSTDFVKDKLLFEGFEGLINLIWNRNKAPVALTIDGVPLQLQSQQIVSTTYLHHVIFDPQAEPLTVFTFNREFYCIKDHDHEVSCNGILFFGTQQTPVISLNEEEARKFELLLMVFEDEFQENDQVQGEMLQMLLKRFIIKATRLAKKQLIAEELNPNQIEIIRKFNVLVDMHYKEKKKVRDYADLLFKSPKTLSNLFATYNHKTPLAIIHERIVLEAKRLLMYSDKSVKEIAYELGYTDVGSFHKLFKKVVNQTPQQFKSSHASW